MAQDERVLRELAEEVERINARFARIEPYGRYVVRRTRTFGSAAAIVVAAASAGVFAFFWWPLPTTMSGER